MAFLFIQNPETWRSHSFKKVEDVGFRGKYLDQPDVAVLDLIWVLGFEFAMEGFWCGGRESGAGGWGSGVGGWVVGRS